MGLLPIPDLVQTSQIYIVLFQPSFILATSIPLNENMKLLSSYFPLRSPLQSRPMDTWSYLPVEPDLEQKYVPKRQSHDQLSN